MKMPEVGAPPPVTFFRCFHAIRFVLFACLFLGLAFDGFFVTLYVVIFFTDISPLTSATSHPYHTEKLIVSSLCLVSTLTAAVACIRESFRISLLATVLLATNVTIQFSMCVALYDPMDLMDCVLVMVTSVSCLLTLLFAILLKKTQIP